MAVFRAGRTPVVRSTRSFSISAPPIAFTVSEGKTYSPSLILICPVSLSDGPGGAFMYPPSKLGVPPAAVIGVFDPPDPFHQLMNPLPKGLSPCAEPIPAPKFASVFCWFAYCCCWILASAPYPAFAEPKAPTDCPMSGEPRFMKDISCC